MNKNLFLLKSKIVSQNLCTAGKIALNKHDRYMANFFSWIMQYVYCALFICQKAIRLTAYNKRNKPDVISYENVVAIITVPLKSESRDE